MQYLLTNFHFYKVDFMASYKPIVKYALTLCLLAAMINFESGAAQVPASDYLNKNPLLIEESDNATEIANNTQLKQQLKDGYAHFFRALDHIQSGKPEAAKIDLSAAKTLFTETANKENNVPALNGLARIALLEKDTESAAKFVEKALSILPNSADTLMLKASVALMAQNQPQAGEIYRQIIQQNKNHIPAYLGLAKLAIKNNELSEAKEYYQNILSINGNYITAYNDLAVIADKQNNPEEAEKQLKTGLDKTKGNQKSELFMAARLTKWYIAHKQPEKSQALADEVIKHYPNNPVALDLLAGALIANGKDQEAEKALTKLIETNSADIKPRLTLALLLGKNPERKKDVLKLFDDALQLEPGNIQPYLFKVNYLLSQKEYREAETIANKAIELFPKSGTGKKLIGDIRLAEKDVAQALLAYQEAYDIQPTQNLLFKLSDIMTIQGRQNEAIKLLETELQKNDKDIALQFKLASHYDRQKRYPEASKLYQAIIAQKPDNAAALNNLAWTLAQQNHPDALKNAKKAYELSPDTAPIMDTYGYILIKEGNIKEGTKILEKAAKLAPGAKSIQFHLAGAYVQLDKRKKAAEILEALLKDAQPFAEVNEAKALLEQIKKP
jgi:tetratricopeptide (TPR) repeat protein